MPTTEQKQRGYLQGERNGTITTLIPAPEELAAAEPEVTVHHTADGVAFVRTPEERFADLPDYPFAPHYAVIDGLQMHYLDEGPRDGETVLLLHGQPASSYLYRRMVTPLAEAGYRVIAPDLIGFGKSDKPIDLRFHHFERQVALVKAFIQTLGLDAISLFAQDWGSCIGLRIVGDRPDLFARVAISNGGLPVFHPPIFYIPEPVELDPAAPSMLEALGPTVGDPFPVAFQAWINFTLTSPGFDPARMIAFMCAAGGRPLSEAEIAAYNAPFPSLLFRAAPRAFPSMVNQCGTRNAAAWRGLAGFTRPFLHVRGTLDTQFGTQEMQDSMITIIPGAKGQPHTALEAGHYIQDNKGEELAALLVDFFASNPINISPVSRVFGA
ncbi:MAG: haloalkane dehalogenase [Erythrobacter sp.]|uniref:haloalkane dehalogenase n=1 Tax=Erythrobacter sp. TaxID=1042 RepID=UPI0025D62266|nr:haloalkane dehalogenase [Erythrobacter sp.]MCM0001333.1 haloalkane dehalogenase [Erythrobacter sp.]